MTSYGRRGDAASSARLFADKLTFGATPDLVAEIEQASPSGWLEVQLAPDDVPEDPRIPDTLSTFQTLHLVGRERASNDLRYLMPREQTAHQLLHAVWSRRQVREVMVEFWADHFNVAFLGGELEMTIREFDLVLRRHALGRFADLLHATARSVAMMVYLDNDASRWPHPNENYARELMELHTLGVGGGYTEDDVQQAARALTGWSHSSLRDDDHWFGFVYDEQHHYSAGPITVMDLVMPAMGGPESIRHGEDLLTYLASHPSTITHVCTKLARRFVADQPPPELVSTMVDAWNTSDGTIAAVLRAMVAHPTFLSSHRGKVRRPFQYLAFALRVLGDSVTINARGGGTADWVNKVEHTLDSMGQRPYRWPAPNGYPDVAGYWASTAGLLSRWNTALAIVRDQIQGMEFHPPLLRQRVDAPTAGALLTRLCQHILGRGPSGPEQEALRLIAGVPLEGPAADIDDERFRALVATVLSVPDANRR